MLFSKSVVWPNHGGGNKWSREYIRGALFNSSRQSHLTRIACFFQRSITFEAHLWCCSLCFTPPDRVVWRALLLFLWASTFDAYLNHCFTPLDSHFDAQLFVFFIGKHFWPVSRHTPTTHGPVLSFDAHCLGSFLGKLTPPFDALTSRSPQFFSKDNWRALLRNEEKKIDRNSSTKISPSLINQ